MNKIIHGDCLDVMKDIPDGSVDDALITDPPYGYLKHKLDVCSSQKQILLSGIDAELLKKGMDIKLNSLSNPHG